MLASFGEVESIFTRISVLLVAVGSVRSDLLVGDVRSRAAAITVVKGRFRRCVTRPRPIPIIR